MYTTVFAYAIVGPLMGLVLMWLGGRLAPRRPQPRTPFESGGNVSPKRWDRLGVCWLGYLPVFLVLFLACGVLVAVAAATRAVGPEAVVALAGFVLPVIFGVAYAWREGMLQWP